MSHVPIARDATTTQPPIRQGYSNNVEPPPYHPILQVIGHQRSLKAAHRQLSLISFVSRNTKLPKCLLLNMTFLPRWKQFSGCRNYSCGKVTCKSFIRGCIRRKGKIFTESASNNFSNKNERKRNFSTSYCHGWPVNTN